MSVSTNQEWRLEQKWKHAKRAAACLTRDSNASLWEVSNFDLWVALLDFFVGSPSVLSSVLKNLTENYLRFGVPESHREWSHQCKRIISLKESCRDLPCLQLTAEMVCFLTWEVEVVRFILDSFRNVSVVLSYCHHGKNSIFLEEI